MRCQAVGVKSGDELEGGAQSALRIDHFLRKIEAATTLDLASLARVGSLRRTASCSNGLSDLTLGDAVADADDHADRLHDNATHSQLDFSRADISWQ